MATIPTSAWKAELEDLRTRLDAAPTPRVGPLSIELRMTPAAAARVQEQKAQMREDQSRFNALISRLACAIVDRPDLSRLAGVSEAALSIELVGQRWPAAVAELTGMPFSADPWLDMEVLKQRSIIAIGRLIAVVQASPAIESPPKQSRRLFTEPKPGDKDIFAPITDDEFPPDMNPELRESLKTYQCAIADQDLLTASPPNWVVWGELMNWYGHHLDQLKFDFNMLDTIPGCQNYRFRSNLSRQWQDRVAPYVVGMEAHLKRIVTERPSHAATVDGMLADLRRGPTTTVHNRMAVADDWTVVDIGTQPTSVPRPPPAAISNWARSPRPQPMRTPRFVCA